MEGLERLSTVSFPERQQLDLWNCWTSGNWSGLSVSSKRRAFPAELAKLQAGSIKFARVKSDESVVMRNPQARDGDRLILHFQKSGASLNRQCGQEAELNSGDFTLLRLDEHYALDTSQGQDLLVAEFDEAPLLERLGTTALAGAIRFDESAPGVRMIGEMIDCLCNGELGDLDSHSAMLIERSFLDLVALAVAGNRLAVAGRGSSALFRIAVAEIERSRDDPALTTSVLAERLGVSPRALQLSFAHVGKTPSAYLMERRLDLAAARLSTRTQNITELAFDCGFNSSAHFTRSFTRRFGVPPRRYRKGPA